MHEQSDALHLRVRRFIDAAMAGAPCEAFDELACDIARFQARAVAQVARLWQAAGRADMQLASEIPAMPCDAFRLRRVAAHAADEDVRCFMTSGTTASARGRHGLRTTATYERAALAWAERMLWPDQAALPMIVLASPEAIAPESSLTFMLARFAEVLGGDVSWHYDGARVDVEGVIARATAQTRPVLVAGTSFAFVHLLDTLAGQRLPLPAGSRVMQTGGFKGRSREIAPAALRSLLATCFALDEALVVGEYGMTELSSQLYQGGACGLRADAYYAPPWVRVTPVDPETLGPTRDEGLARIVDLANVDSAVAIQTADRVRQNDDGSVQLLGRAPGATPRGCSLALEHLLEDGR